MTASATSSGVATQVEDLVFEVVCARARQTFAPLPMASLRGLLGRCEVRPRDLAVLGDRPVDMLVGASIQKAEGQRLGMIFAAAAMRRSAALSPRGREAFARRLEDLVAAMHERTPIRFPGSVRALAPVQRSNEVTRGGDFTSSNSNASPWDEAMEGLLHALPPIAPRRPPRRAAPRSIPPPRATQLPASARRFLRPPAPVVMPRATLAWLGLELPPIESKTPPPAEPELVYEGEATPRATRIRRTRPRKAQDILASEGLDPLGRRPGAWTRPAALAAGASACVIGLPLALEGLLIRDPVWVALGAALAVGGIGLDGLLRTLGPRIFSRRKNV